MNFISTRGGCPPASVSDAIIAGMAPDGGLYVPESFPRLSAEALDPQVPFADRALAMLAPFFEGDPLEDELPAICSGAFDFPVPLVQLATGGAGAPVRVLELFHGPTAAFKDFGARFLARCMRSLERSPDGARATAHGGSDKVSGPLTILVATSGDTGGAVAAAFHGMEGIEVRVLFPENGVSARQRRQLTCWDGNVRSFAVRGSFDDCQRLVKAAFRDLGLSAMHRLSSANSINLGRLLPQMAYYLHAAAIFKAETGVEPMAIIPSGNLGNAVGAYWARAMGAPLGRIVMAFNSNRAVPDLLESGEYTPRPGIPTIANAMDVGDPSNLERLRWLYPGIAELRREAAAYSVDDGSIRESISRSWTDSGYAFCPHGAAAEHVRTHHFPDEPALVVATAHPAKFETVVEPLIGRTVPVPPSLEALLRAPSRFLTIDPEMRQLFPSG